MLTTSVSSLRDDTVDNECVMCYCAWRYGGGDAWQEKAMLPDYLEVLRRVKTSARSMS